MSANDSLEGSSGTPHEKAETHDEKAETHHETAETNDEKAETHHETAETNHETAVTPESTLQINIKTLDSQIHKCDADKEMLVSVFKEKIASQVGVPMEQQRLIFRGKVLEDTHLLSEYHLENGDTLHLVVRQPQPSQGQPSSSSNTGDATANNNGRGQEPGFGVPRGRVGQISHSVVLGTFGVGGEQGEGGAIPDLSQVIGAVLNSIGVGSLGGAQPNMPFGSPIQNPQTTETAGRGSGTGSQSQTGNQAQPGHPFPGQSHPRVVQVPVGASVPIPSFNMPIPESVNTLSEFISRMEVALSRQVAGDQQGQSPNDTANIARTELPTNRGVPTPDALGIVMREAQRLINGPAAESLSRIAGRLEQEAGSTDTSVRSQIQNESVQVGLAMQHLGALFLELGRTILTLRMGHSPAESSVNAGPAVYISPFGPNPIMVQPFPLQMSSLFSGSAGNLPHPSAAGPIGVGGIPRNVNIHIHTGASMAPFAPGAGARSTTGGPTQGENVTGTVFGGSGQSQAPPVPNMGNPIPLGQTVIAMSGNGVGNPQSHSDSIPLSAMIAEANSQLQSLVDNVRNERQAASGNGVGGTNIVVDRGAQPESERQDPGNSALSENSKSEPSSSDIPSGSASVPLGLGLGGLQPRRRGRQNSGEGSSAAPNQLQNPSIIGQQILQSLANLPGRSNASTHAPSRSVGGQTASDNQQDVSDALSQALQSPALGGLLAGVSQQTGIGSPNALMSMLEQITQNPAMRNTVSQIAQQIDNNDLENMFAGMGGGGGGGQGGGAVGFDMSRMFQQMMPIVSQALGGGASAGMPSQPSVGSAAELRSRSMRENDSQSENPQPDSARNTPGEVIFTSVVRNVAEQCGEDEVDQESVLNELCNDQGLATEFAEMLRQDVARRLEDENAP